MQYPDTQWPATVGSPFFTPNTTTWRGAYQGVTYDLPYVLSRLPEYLRNWTYAIATKLDVDPGMALAALLSGMGAGLNGGMIVRRPDGGMEPPACFSVILAGPTTGKTRTHKLVHTCHNAQDICRYKSYQQEKRTTVDGDGHSPKRTATPRLRTIILQDTSNRGLLEALEGVGESAAISIHEGQKALESILFRKHLDTLNLLYDGEGRAMITRGKGDRVIAHNATLTSLVMVQPDIFGAYIEKHGRMAHGIGFLARCLFTTVSPFRIPVDRLIMDPDACLQPYHVKVATFLEERLAKLEAGETDPAVIDFSPGACQLWQELLVEHRNLTNTVYRHVADAANRAMQNVARVAGKIQCYLDVDAEVSVESLDAAWTVVQWHMTQFAELFPPKPIPAQPPPKLTAQGKQRQRELEDCSAIVNCITELCWRNGECDVLKSKVAIRSALYNARFRTALMRLVDEGVVLESGEGAQTRLSFAPQREMAHINQPAWVSTYNGGI